MVWARCGKQCYVTAEQQRIAELEAEVPELRALVAELRASINRNSSNSSMPPSSDTATERATFLWGERDLNALKILKRHVEAARKHGQNPYAALVQLHTTGPWPLPT